MMHPAPRSSGFTIVELLIAVSIIAIITGAMVPTFTGYINKQNVTQAAELIKSDLRSVQNKALTGSLSDQMVGSPSAQVEYWGVAFTSSSNYTFFVGSNSAACQNNSAQGSGFLSNGAIVTTTCNICFSIKDGGIYGSGNCASPITVRSSDGTITKAINFNSAGLIY
jgi:prepilin-type N-terminal cleavage/methylation domain-containing protein